MIRFLTLLGWAVLVIIAGGAAVKAGVSPVLAGGLEVAAIALGVIAVMLTPAWRRSVQRSQQRAGTRY